MYASDWENTILIWLLESTLATREVASVEGSKAQRARPPSPSAAAVGVAKKQTAVSKARRVGSWKQVSSAGDLSSTGELEDLSGKLMREVSLVYAHKHFDAFVHDLSVAPPMQLLETERKGIDAAFMADMAKRMDVSYSHLAETMGIPKATAARKLSNHDRIDGAAAIALARLLAIAKEIVEDSTASEAKTFDTAKWLGQWIERPQPALGGHKPSELLDTPTGVGMVTKVLGAIRSGAYQ